jgi:hypothetical protein
MAPVRYAEERLEGKALEEAFERGPGELPTVIKMRRHDDAPWELVGTGPQAELHDPHVPGIVAKMARVRERVAAALGGFGWAVAGARLFVGQDSLDLRLVRAGPATRANAALVELVWSRKTAARAATGAEAKLGKYWKAARANAAEAVLVGTLGVNESRLHFSVYRPDGELVFFRSHRHLNASWEAGCQKRDRGIGTEQEATWRAENAELCRGYSSAWKASRPKPKPKPKPKPRRKAKAKAKPKAKVRKAPSLR